MAYEGCIAKVTEFMKGKLNEKQVADVVRALEKSLERETKNVIAGRASPDSIPTFLADEAKRIVEAIDIETKIAKRAELINTRARIARRGEILKNIEREGGDLAKGMQAKLVGTNKSRNSTAAQQVSAHDRAVGAFLNDINQADLVSIANNSLMDKLIAREMFQLTSKDGKPGITGSKDALRLAEIFTKHLDVARKVQNKAGAAIGKLDGFIVSQSHDRAKIRKAGFTKWAEDILPLLDKEKTFGNNDPMEFLQGAYNTIVTGQSQKSIGLATDNTRAFKGYSNLAKKASHSRSIHFKDADAWMTYNDMHGTGALRESVVSGIIHGHSNATLMRNFGTNPRAQFEADLEWIKKNYRDKNPEAVADFQNREKILRRYFDEIDGTSRVAANISLAHAGSIFRAINNMTMLGGATISSITDIPVMASEIRFQKGTAGMFEGYRIALENIMKGRRSGEQREIADLLGVGFDGIIGSMVSRHTTNDSLVGTFAKMQQKFFKLNLQNWWTDSHKTGVALMMSRNLAEDAPKEFGALTKEARRLMGMYNIGEAEWNVIRQSAAILDDGKSYITPDAIREVPDEVISKYVGELTASKSKIERARAELEDKLGAYFSDRVDYAILTPGAKERADLMLGTQSGTAIGEAWRFITQFKSFSVAMATKVYGREFAASGKADVAGIVHLAVMTTAFGYMAMTAKEFLAGKKPRTADNLKDMAKIVGAAMAQGGGAGILGDFIFGEANRYGGTSPLISVMGPTASRLESAIKLGGAARRELIMGDDADLASKTFRETLSYVPGNNLFYLRNALNYLFIYDIQESLNPGYLRRMEKRIKKENNQEFFFPPSQSVR